MKDAWHSICNDSFKLGIFRSPEEYQTHDPDLTGSRELFGFFDLGSSYKVVMDDKKSNTFWLAGVYNVESHKEYPAIASFKRGPLSRATGWLVFEC